MKFLVLDVCGKHVPVHNRADAIRTASTMIRNAEMFGLCPGKIELKTHEFKGVSTAQLMVAVMRGEIDNKLNYTGAATDATPKIEIEAPIETALIGRVESDGTVLASGCRLPAKLGETPEPVTEKLVEDRDAKATKSFDAEVEKAKAEAAAKDAAAKPASPVTPTPQQTISPDPQVAQPSKAPAIPGAIPGAPLAQPGAVAPQAAPAAEGKAPEKSANPKAEAAAARKADLEKYQAQKKEFAEKQAALAAASPAKPAPQPGAVPAQPGAVPAMPQPGAVPPA